MKKFTVNPTLATVIFALLFACDSFKDEVVPTTDVLLTGKEVFVLSNGNTIIDMKNMVKTTQPVRVEITSQPTKGSLAEIQNGLIQYTPTSAGTKGKDGFNVSIFSAKENTLLKKDTVKIVIGNDPKEAPLTGLYAQGDAFYAVKGETDIYPLKNDIIPFDSSLIRLVIWKPEPNYPPYSGTAVVSNNRVIRYTPGANFIQDKMLYKIYNATDTTQFAFGSIYLGKEDYTCETTLLDDTYSLFAGDQSLALDVISNDKLIDSKAGTINVVKSLEILKAPKYGNAAVVENKIKYTLSNSIFVNELTDTLTYRVCSTCNCGIAKAIITITNCKPEAVADSFEITKDETKSAQINLTLLENDKACGGKLKTDNIKLFTKPVYGGLGVSNDFYTYTLPSTAPKNVTDSLSYAICIGNNCSTPVSVKIKIK